MASFDALNTRQFQIEQQMYRQGNEDGLANRVRGFQNMSSNIYRPAFSADYTSVRSQPSGTAFGGGGMGGGESVGGQVG
jgi:hypothetical protein